MGNDGALHLQKPGEMEQVEVIGNRQNMTRQSNVDEVFWRYNSNVIADEYGYKKIPLRASNAEARAIYYGNNAIFDASPAGRLQRARYDLAVLKQQLSDRRPTQEEIDQHVNQDALTILKGTGVLAIMAATGGLASEIPAVAVALGAYGSYGGAQDMANGHPVLGGVELAGNLVGLGLAARSLSQATTMAEAFGAGRPGSMSGRDWSGAALGLDDVANTANGMGSAADNIYSSVTPMGDQFPQLSGVNPHYVEGAGPGVNINCTSCANVAQQRLLGIDPDAFASPSAGYGTKNSLLPSAPFGFGDPMSGDAAMAEMLGRGEGATSPLIIQQPGAPSHVITATVQNGQVFLIDAQMGSVVTLKPSVVVELGSPGN